MAPTPRQKAETGTTASPDARGVWGPCLVRDHPATLPPPPPGPQPSAATRSDFINLPVPPQQNENCWGNGQTPCESSDHGILCARQFRFGPMRKPEVSCSSARASRECGVLLRQTNEPTDPTCFYEHLTDKPIFNGRHISGSARTFGVVHLPQIRRIATPCSPLAGWSGDSRVVADQWVNPGSDLPD